MHSLLGIVLGLFLVFRTNTAYDRWWEGRQQWGALIIASRSLARLTSLLAREDRQSLLRGVCAFTAGLAARLRQHDEQPVIARWCGNGPWQGAPNPHP